MLTAKQKSGSRRGDRRVSPTACGIKIRLIPAKMILKGPISVLAAWI